MNHRPFLSLAAAATFGTATVASAGMFFGSGSGNVDQMMVGDGYFDFTTGGGFAFVDILALEDPPVESGIAIYTTVPGVETTGALLAWTATEGPTAVFFSESLLQLESDVPDPFDGAFAGQRLTFTTDVDVEVNLTGVMSLSGDAIGFLYVYQEGFYEPIVFTGDVAEYTVLLSAGTNKIAWGVLGAIGDGGEMASADMEAVVTLTLVPSPGAVCLLASAGLVGVRSRRR